MISLRRLFAGLALTSLLSCMAFAHIAILPQESVTGIHEKYIVRVPNEKDSASITQIEVQFPAGLEIYGYEPKQGWKVDLKKDAQGKISAAIWTGSIDPHEFLEFGLLGVNPKHSANLVWKAVQTYSDGTREEFVNDRGRLPAPIVIVRSSGYSSLRLGK